MNQWRIVEATPLVGGGTRYTLTHPEYEIIRVLDDNKGKRIYTWDAWGGEVEHAYRIQAGAAINRYLTRR